MVFFGIGFALFQIEIKMKRLGFQLKRFLSVLKRYRER